MKRNAKCIFNSTTDRPDYAAHSGQVVTIVRALTRREADISDVGAMYRIAAADGWQGDVFADELGELAQ